MAKKEALRELQERLARQLAEARTKERRRSWLAIESGGHGFLLPLHEAGEIFSPVPCAAVSHTQPWFMGVANLRGHLHAVVDLAQFLGLRGHALVSVEGAREASRYVAFSPTLDINCALVVDKLSGLRNADQLTPADAESDAGERPAFAGARLRDVQGRVWQELTLSALAADESFLKIVG
jgi:twitching motility protein PilI